MFFGAVSKTTMCGILVPGPGTEPVSLAEEVWSPNRWTTITVVWEALSFVACGKRKHFLIFPPSPTRTILMLNPFIKIYR